MTAQTLGKLHEQTANKIIADWLNAAGRSWTAAGERRQALIGNNRRPDITIRQTGRRPVVIESEFGNPAVADARSRLGETLVGETHPFTEAIAIGINAQCEYDDDGDFRQRLDNNEPILTIQLVLGESPEHAAVWPSQPMPATPADLAAYCEYAQVPQSIIDRQSANIAARIAATGTQLLQSVCATANLAAPTLQRLYELTGVRHRPSKPKDPKACPDKCDHNAQAANTACAVWLIAIDLQNDLAVHSPALQTRELVTTDAIKAGANGVLLPGDLLRAWQVIEGVNYLPVMDTATATLQAVPVGNVISDILDSLANLSAQLNALHAKHIYNFAGELWQRLVSDREERAAHYTRPEIAEMLSTLAAERFYNLPAEKLAGLNLWDGACGTGTLLGAGERSLRRRYLLRGGRDLDLHRKRMEEHIYAMDVNGIAGTLTAKRLTDLEVTQDYAHSKIAVVTHQAGSLYLLDRGLTTITDYLGQGGRSGVTTGLDGKAGPFGINPGGVHWALMNPPYSRPKRGQGMATTGLPSLRRKAASARQNGRGYAMSHGQAGLASDFSNVANIRLAPGGVYSFVLPLTAAHAESWQSYRAEMETDFEDIVAIANVGATDHSMSADTHMNEMLVVATKKQRRPSEWQRTTVTAVNLHSPPATLEQGYAIAKAIASIPANYAQGNILHGNYVKVATISPGFPWFALGNANTELTAVAAALLNGRCWHPQALAAADLSLPIVNLDNIAASGPTQHLIGYPKGGDPIGAFEWSPLAEWKTPATHTAMWAADSESQTTIAARPTHGGQPVNIAEAQRMNNLKSRYMISRQLRWTSQAVAFATTAAPVHGGTAWNALQNLPASVGQACALFFNSTFGAIIRSCYGQSTQPGRARLQVKAIAGIPCPNFAANDAAAQRALTIAQREFLHLSQLRLEPFAYCFRDANRHRIDDVVAEMLGLDPASAGVQEMLAHWRILFASEPNINGRQRAILDALTEYQNAVAPVAGP